MILEKVAGLETSYTEPTLADYPGRPTALAKIIHRCLLSAVLLAASPFGVAVEQPGVGIEVQPLTSGITEEAFQTLLVAKALKALGYQVKPIQKMGYAAGHIALANGAATFMASHWDPLHADFYQQAGGDLKLYRGGAYISNCVQGYLIDKRIATAFGIRTIAELQNPKIASLFDADGDGKADLAGCSPGWGCAKVIERHLDAYGLRDTVTHHQGSYAALIADTIARYEQLQPILYYTWTPFWVSGTLVPDQDVVWLPVPPDEVGAVDAALGSGFQINVQRIVANREWVEANPAAARLFDVMQLDDKSVSAQNLVMHNGEDSAADINRHADAWIKAHRWTFAAWLEQARGAAAD